MTKRRDLLKLAGFTPLAALSAAGTPLGNVVMDEKQAKLTRDTFGELRIFFDGPTAQLKSMTAGSLRLKAGMQPHPPHEHPDEEFLLVTEGSGEISIEGKVTKVGPGSMMYCGGNRLHGIVNTGKVPMLFYFYKWRS